MTINFKIPALVSAIFFVALTGCSQAPSVTHTQFLAFGTLVDLTLAGATEKQTNQASEILDKDFEEMHKAWHAWDPGPLGRANRLIANGESFSAPPSVLTLITVGKELSAQSDGLFNPAIGHLIDTWGFHSNDPNGHKPPEKAKLEKLLTANPQMSDLIIDGISLKSTNPAVKLDFGAFGKGYGISLAMKRLQQLGIENAIINAGGDLQVIGTRNGEPWRIGIRHPSGKGVLATLKSQGNESVFTSGDYERNFTWEGQRYHHIIDPRTGYPAIGTRSVTVVDSDATRADAAATALFIAGPDLWHDIAQQMGVSQVLLVDDRDIIHMTPEMSKRIELDVPKEKIRISAPIQSINSSLTN